MWFHFFIELDDFEGASTVPDECLSLDMSETFEGAAGLTARNGGMSSYWEIDYDTARDLIEVLKDTLAKCASCAHPIIELCIQSGSYAEGDEGDLGCDLSLSVASTVHLMESLETMLPRLEAETKL